MHLKAPAANDHPPRDTSLSDVVRRCRTRGRAAEWGLAACPLSIWQCWRTRSHNSRRGPAPKGRGRRQEAASLVARPPPSDHPPCGHSDSTITTWAHARTGVSILRASACARRLQQLTGCCTCDDVRCYADVTVRPCAEPTPLDRRGTGVKKTRTQSALVAV